MSENTPSTEPPVPFRAGGRRYHAAADLQHGLKPKSQGPSTMVLCVCFTDTGEYAPQSDCLSCRDADRFGAHYANLERTAANRRKWINSVYVPDTEQDSPEYQDEAMARMRRECDRANRVLGYVVAAFVVTVLAVLAGAVYVFTR